MGDRALASSVRLPHEIQGLVALPVPAEVPRCRVCQGAAEHLKRQATVANTALVLAPREFGDVPVQVLYREAMMDAPVGPPHAREQALDLVRRDALAMLVGHLVVYARELVETDEIVIGRMLVGEDVSTRRDVLPDHVPSTVGILASGNP